ncbi:MAG: sensor histidine kinase [Chitinophagaceae bacterium]
MDSKIEIYLIAFFISFILFIIGLISFFILFRSKQRLNLKEKAMLKKEYEQSLLQAQLEVQQQTMEYIGREIHDNVGQKLTLASLLSQQLHLSTKDDRIKNIIDAVDEGLQDLRSLSKSLTITGIQELSFLDLLQIEAKNVELLKKQQLNINSSPNFTINIPQTKLIVLRIVQEFIQNSLKHAQCNTITISLFTIDKRLEIILQDDGVGFNSTENSNGIGLSNMQKRASLINASFELLSYPYNGTTLKLMLNNNSHEA